MERLRAYHLAIGKRHEALSYVWARAVVTSDKVLVVVPHNAPVKLFAPDCFIRQSAGNVQLQPDVLNGMLVEFAASDFNCLINVHDHWFSDSAAFSCIDDRDDINFDRYLREAFEPMLAQNPHIGPVRHIVNLSVVLARKGVEARIVDARRKRRFLPAARFDVIGERLDRLTSGHGQTISHDNEMFSRQRDFVSPDRQALLSEITVALAGCGGLGSIIAESLARCGVGGLVLIDDDRLDTSNLNRWQGARPDRVGEPKARLLAANLRSMFPKLRLDVLGKSLYERDSESLLGSADLIVGGLDNDEARYFLNRVSLQYGVPYLDAGTAIIGKDMTVDFCTRYFAVVPGVTACLECTQLTLFDRVGTLDAYLDEETASARRQAGYAREMPSVSAPSVYGLNQRAASLLVIELLNFICGWRPLATSITESWREGRFERLSRDNFPESPDRECPVCGYYAGAVNTEELPRPGGHRRESRQSPLRLAGWTFSGSGMGKTGSFT